MTVRALIKLNSISFRTIIWALPVVFLFHELEEWNILVWYERFYVDMPASTDFSVRIWIITISLAGFLLTGLTLIPKNPKVTAYLIVPLIALTVSNGLQHEYWLFYFKAYAPGVVFGGVIGVVLGVYIIYRAIAEKSIPFWYPLLFVPYIAMVLKSTVEAGNKLSPSIRAVHEIGLALASLFV
jgi:hypothetical protein